MHFIQNGLGLRLSKNQLFTTHKTHSLRVPPWEIDSGARAVRGKHPKGARSPIATRGQRPLPRPARVVNKQFISRMIGGS